MFFLPFSCMLLIHSFTSKLFKKKVSTGIVTTKLIRILIRSIRKFGNTFKDQLWKTISLVHCIFNLRRIMRKLTILGKIKFTKLSSRFCQVFSSYIYLDSRRNHHTNLTRSSILAYVLTERNGGFATGLDIVASQKRQINSWITPFLSWSSWYLRTSTRNLRK